MKIFQDTILLQLNTADLSYAITVARDLRSCTKTIIVGPAFFLANGPSGMRTITELGITGIVLDLRLMCTPTELDQIVGEMAQLGVKGLSIHALSGPTSIRRAVDAAKQSTKQTLRVRRPAIILNAVDDKIDDAELVDDIGMRMRRSAHLTHVARQAADVGADALILQYDDIKQVRRVNKNLTTLVYAQRRPHNYAETNGTTAKGISEILAAKADHVIIDSELVAKTDLEWTADLITKELRACEGAFA